MKALWQWLFDRPPSKPSSRRFRPGVEGLEQREVLSAGGLPAPVILVGTAPSAQQRLLGGLKDPSPGRGSRPVPDGERIIRGSNKHVHHRGPGPKLGPPMLLHEKPARQRLLDGLKDRPWDPRPRPPAKWEGIIRGSTKHHRHPIPKPKPKPPRLPLNRHPRRIKVEYLNPQDFESFDYGTSNEDWGTTYHEHITYLEE